MFDQSFDISFPSRADSPRQRETTAEDTGAGKGLFGWGDLGAVGIDGIPANNAIKGFLAVPNPVISLFTSITVRVRFFNLTMEEHADVLVRVTGALTIGRGRIPSEAAGCEGVHGLFLWSVDFQLQERCFSFTVSLPS